MKLSGLTLETIYFEDYLCFLTEVLELELKHLTEISMRLDLKDTWLEIKKVPQLPPQLAPQVEFSLDPEEYESLKYKVSFFYYRHGPTRFLFLDANEEHCRLVDPDGRIWRFIPTISLHTEYRPNL